jgi:hypothetical protein
MRISSPCSRRRDDEGLLALPVGEIDIDVVGLQIFQALLQLAAQDLGGIVFINLDPST